MQFFKEAKQLLKLGKCQLNDFDAQITGATMTMVQYILLALKFRYENYESKPDMFAQIKEDTLLQRLDQRYRGYSSKLYGSLLGFLKK